MRRKRRKSDVLTEIENIIDFVSSYNNLCLFLHCLKYIQYWKNAGYNLIFYSSLTQVIPIMGTTRNVSLAAREYIFTDLDYMKEVCYVNETRTSTEILHESYGKRLVALIIAIIGFIEIIATAQKSWSFFAWCP